MKFQKWFLFLFVYDLIRKWVTGNETAINRKGDSDREREREEDSRREGGKESTQWNCLATFNASSLLLLSLLNQLIHWLTDWVSEWLPDGNWQAAAATLATLHAVTFFYSYEFCLRCFYCCCCCFWGLSFDCETKTKLDSTRLALIALVAVVASAAYCGLPSVIQETACPKLSVTNLAKQQQQQQRQQWQLQWRR